MSKFDILPSSFNYFIQFQCSQKKINSSIFKALYKESISSFNAFSNINFIFFKKKKNSDQIKSSAILRANFFFNLGEKTTSLLSLNFLNSDKKLIFNFLSKNFFSYFFQNLLIDFKLGNYVVFNNISSTISKQKKIKEKLKIYIFLFLFLTRKWGNNFKLITGTLDEIKKRNKNSYFISFFFRLIVWVKKLKKNMNKIFKKINKKSHFFFIQKLCIKHKVFKNNRRTFSVFINFFLFQNLIF
jgi:hypothetical protein